MSRRPPELVVAPIALTTPQSAPQDESGALFRRQKRLRLFAEIQEAEEWLNAIVFAYYYPYLRMEQGLDAAAAMMEAGESLAAILNASDEDVVRREIGQDAWLYDIETFDADHDYGLSQDHYRYIRNVQHAPGLENPQAAALKWFRRRVAAKDKLIDRRLRFD